MRQQQQGGGMSWVVGHRTGQGQANGLTCSSNQRNQGTLTTRQPRISRQPPSPRPAVPPPNLTCSSNQRNQGTLTTLQPRISRQRHLATERPSGTYGSEREKCQPPSTSTARRLDAVHAVQGQYRRLEAGQR